MPSTAVQKPQIRASGREKTHYSSTKTANSGVARVFYGVRYLDPKTSRWISADPAMGEYIPQAPINDEAKKNNKNLPGMGGVFNYVNFHVYHYAGNNPVKLIDPDGRDIQELTDEQWNIVKKDIDSVVENLDNIIQELADFDAGKINVLSPDLLTAANDFLGVDFSLPLDARELGRALTDIKDHLGSMTRDDFRYDSSTTKYAWTIPFGEKIYLGNEYFNSTNNGYDTRQGTLVHEATHKFKVRGTFDWAYGPGPSSTLRVDNRVNRKASNADSWEYFYERIFTSQGGRR